MQSRLVSGVHHAEVCSPAPGHITHLQQLQTVLHEDVPCHERLTDLP